MNEGRPGGRSSGLIASQAPIGLSTSKTALGTRPHNLKHLNELGGLKFNCR